MSLREAARVARRMRRSTSASTHSSPSRPGVNSPCCRTRSEVSCSRADRATPGASPKASISSEARKGPRERRSEEHTSELQSRGHLVCRLLLEKKKQQQNNKNR